jgi:hypothetical protein
MQVPRLACHFLAVVRRARFFSLLAFLLSCFKILGSRSGGEMADTYV